jgi:hypothetical protein
MPDVLAGGILARAGLADVTRPRATVIATRLFGAGAVRLVGVGDLHGHRSRSVHGRAGWRIELYEALPREDWSMEVAFHVAVICLPAERCDVSLQIEDQVARALVLPRSGLLPLMACAESDAPRLARAYATTEQVVRDRLDDLRIEGARRFDD